MNRQRLTNIQTYIGAALVIFTLLCRCSTPVADTYATAIYPMIADCLSFVSHRFPLPLQELTVGIILVLILRHIWLLAKHRERWTRCLIDIATILMWTYAWFYTSWCNNYSRSSLIQRTNTQMAQYDEQAFINFINEFADSINAAWTTNTLCTQEQMETDIKAFYASVPRHYGLATPRSWHHEKHTPLNRFYSAVGTAGFMAPLYAESFVNTDVLAYDHPFVFAHEYSHLLGVSNEAEANWWAYHACTASTNAAIRYSGYKGILAHIYVNAVHALPDDKLRLWQQRLRKEVVTDLIDTRQHWDSLHSEHINDIQTNIYDLFLKGNNISSGIKNYSEVIGLLISVKR